MYEFHVLIWQLLWDLLLSHTENLDSLKSKLINNDFDGWFRFMAYQP